VGGLDVSGAAAPTPVPREHEESIVKYMILTFGTQQEFDGMAGKPGTTSVWTAEDFAALGKFMTAFNEELEKSGELVETRGLVNPVHTRRVALRNGVTAVTDGPYAETQEVLAGYWIVDCASFDRAVEIAGRMSNCPLPAGTSEAYADVRPVAESQADLDF